MISLIHPINYYFLAIIIFDVIYVFIMSWLIVLIALKHKGKKYMGTVTKPLVYFSISVTFSNFVHIITHFETVFVETMNIDVFYMMGYAVYTLTWLLGIDYYLKYTIRLAPQIRKRFSFFIYSLFIFASISFIFVLIMSIFPEATKIFQRTVFLLIFAGLGFGISIIFIIFIRIINGERERNPSKIVKARIDLLTRVLVIQILLGLIFFLLSTLVIIFPKQRYLLNLIFFWVSDTLSLISVVFLYWSVEIPNHIRMKYNLSPSRFQLMKT